MSFEFGNLFGKGKEVKPVSPVEDIADAVDDVNSLLNRVQEKVGEENVGKRVAELIDKDGELTVDEKGELERGLHTLEGFAKQTVEQGGETAVEEINPYAAPEALGIDTPPLKESQVLYPEADAPLHKPLESKDVKNMGEDAANPHGFKEVA